MSSRTEEIQIEITAGEPNRIPFSFFMSLLAHALFIIIPGLLVNVISSPPPAGNSYVVVNTTYDTPSESVSPDTPTEEVPEENTQADPETVPPKDETETGTNSGAGSPLPASAFTSAFAGADTNSLQQVYSESTLNVRIRFPLGWSFQDNNVKNKLDAVTFIGPVNQAAYIPYVILEVKKKHLFYPSRFKYNMPVPSGNYTAYYSDPKEMENLVTQVVYIRTEADEDYALTLRINGMQNYLEYRPVFMSMLKSFKFGRSLF